jgi:diacylglycerol kinase
MSSIITKIFDLKDFGKNLKIAIIGLKTAFFKEQSFRIQVFIGISAFILMFVFPLTICERTIIVLTIGAVLGFELINSQIEKVLDIVRPEFHPKVKVIKDLSAAAVLIVSISSALIGLLIFLPHFLKLFRFQ